MLCLNGSLKQDVWASLLYSSLLETEEQSPCDSHSGRLQIETALQTVCVQWILTGFFSLGCDVQSDCRRPCRNNSWWILRRKHIQPNNDKIIHYLENTFLKKYSRFIDTPWSNRKFIINRFLKINKLCLHQWSYSENQSEHSAETIVYHKSVWLFKEA